MRDTLPSHAAKDEVYATPETQVDGQPEGIFRIIKNYRRRAAMASALGTLSLSNPLELKSSSLASPLMVPAQAIGSRPEASSFNLSEPKEVIILEDRVKQSDYWEAYSEMEKVAKTGASAVKITAQWVIGQMAPSEKDMQALKNAVEAAQELDLKVILTAYPCSHIEKACETNAPPLNQWERGKFSNWLATLAYHLPDVQDFVIGNEINSATFWWPQYYRNGTYAAAESYFKLLATSYDVLKKAASKREGGKEITVYGMALSSKGTYPPLKFLEKFHKAYIDSGRKKPVLDVISYHPYPTSSSEMPDQKHQGDLVGIADYPELIKGLKKAFSGTPQARSELVIAYDEYGIQTKIPKNKDYLYIGEEPPNTGAVTEAEQAANLATALEIAACQPRVISFAQFLNRDERNKKRWQSGLRYYDGTPKSSLDKVKLAIEDFETGGEVC